MKKVHKKRFKKPYTKRKRTDKINMERLIKQKGRN